MRSSNAPIVAVIGGGIAGLVAAWELAQQDFQVHLYERENYLGGRIRQSEILGDSYDLGAESFATREGKVTALLEALGLSDEIESPNQLQSWVVNPDCAAPLPRTGILGIPIAPLRTETRRILGLFGALRAAIEPLLPPTYGRKARTVAELVRLRFGSKVLTRLVAPVTRGVYSTDPAMLAVAAVPGFEQARQSHRSLTTAAKKLRQSTQSAGGAVAGLRGGMGRLVEELTQQLLSLEVTIYKKTTVTSVVDTAAGLRLEVDGHTHSGPATVLAVVVTVPDVRVLPSDEEHVTAVGGQAASVQTQPAMIEVVAMLLDNAALTSAPRGTGALVASETGHAEFPIRAKALTHSSAKWQWLAKQLPENRHLIRLSYGEHRQSADPTRAAPTLGMSDAEVLHLACQDATRIFGLPIQTDQVLDIARQAFSLQPRDAVSNGTGRDSNETSGVFHAGEWVSGTGLASVIPVARSAARECADFVATSPRRTQRRATSNGSQKSRTAVHAGSIFKKGY